MSKTSLKYRLPLLGLVLLLITVFNSSFFIPSDNIKIRIYTHVKIQSVQLNINSGEYTIQGDGKFILNCSENNAYKVIPAGNGVSVYENGNFIGNYAYLKFNAKNGSEMKVKITNPNRKPRIYLQHLIFTNLEGILQIVNDAEMDKYICGVTEAESGYRSSDEYYKVQAILARTFALAHMHRHSTEGYSLCDQVHCQVYYGKPRSERIAKSVYDTKNLVVVDENLNLIVAAFHSNSGGQTANSEDVWGSKTSYLRSIIDTFSTVMPHANWSRKMLTEDWLTYLKLKHNYPVDDAEALDIALNFKQPERKSYLVASAVKVPLRHVRQDLQLRSTFFSIKPLSSDSILFEGKGYGHGLGMCQEGAMNMSKLGYTYDQILHFYYQNISIIDMKKLSFFKDE